MFQVMNRVIHRYRNLLDKSSNIESDVHAGISTNKRQSGAKPPVIDESSENDNGTISTIMVH